MLHPSLTPEEEKCCNGGGNGAVKNVIRGTMIVIKSIYNVIKGANIETDGGYKYMYIHQNYSLVLSDCYRDGTGW